MVASVNRSDVQRLAEQGAQIVEVLPPAEFDDEHLPAARNLPLKTLGPHTVGDLDPGVPVVVYCWDSL
jgi:rhodanese-related sulfurtransferase